VASAEPYASIALRPIDCRPSACLSSAVDYISTRGAPIMLWPIIGRLPIVYFWTHLRSIKVVL